MCLIEVFLVIFMIATIVAETSEGLPQDFANGSLVTENSTQASRPGGVNPRIINGVLARPFQYPFVVKLRWMFYYTKPKGKVEEVQCSAVIIGLEFVTTAASCFQIIIKDKNKTGNAPLDIPLTRDYGRTFVQMDGETEMGDTVKRVRSGVRLIVPSAYVRPSLFFDMNIALVQVVPRWGSWESRYLRIPTPASNLLPMDGHLYACHGVGTGKIKKGEHSWEDQKKSSLELSTGGFAYCNYLHKEFNQQNVHVDTFYMCGKTKKQGQDFCGGDIGSALVCNGLLAGILSQRIVRFPCQLTGNQFTMFTAVGSRPIYKFIKKYVPSFRDPEDIPLPPDPWGKSGSATAGFEWLDMGRNVTTSVQQ